MLEITASKSHTIKPKPPNSALAHLEKLIERGRSSAKAVVDDILTHQPTDYLVRSTGLTFHEGSGNRPALLLNKPSAEPASFTFSDFALGQVADKLGIPRAFVERLRSGDAPLRALLIHNLNQLGWQEERRYLVRVSRGGVNGFLSDKFRRLDSRPILESFIRAASHAGAMPYEGIQGEASFALKAILPVVHEIGQNDAVAFGLELANSDFGARALSISLLVIRVWCGNGAVLSTDLRRIHLGQRLEDGIDFSRKTHDLDTATICSAISDIVARNLLPEKITTITELIDRSAREFVSPAQLTGWLKKNLNKNEAEAVTQKFNSPDIELLPPGQNLWRFSNSLSWFAGTLNGERKLDMQRLAGKVLMEVAQ